MIQKLDDILHTFSKWGVTLCVFLMLSLTLLNISLRWFEVSFLWIEPLVRHLVFIAAFLGGSLATGEKHHIKIDVLSRLLEKFEKKRLIELLDIVITLVTFVAAVTLLNASIDLSQVEFEYGKEEFLNIHSGYLVSIIPAGMALISMRLLMRFILLVKKGAHSWN